MTARDPRPGAVARRGGAALAVAVAVTLGLAACGSNDDGTVTPSPSSPSSPSSSSSPGGSPSPSSPSSPSEPTTPSSPPEAEGCAPTQDGTPDGAGTASVIDVDGDGQPDTAWITPGAGRRFGITTFSGATFSVAIDAAAPIRATAVVNRVGPHGVPVALVDTGRSVALVSLAGCQARAVKNVQGDPYTFDKGFTGYGTGVGCFQHDGALTLAGLDATSGAKGERFTVTRTWVDLSDDGATATNGAKETLGHHKKASSRMVRQAQRTSCGDLVAGTDGPTEPQG